MKFDQLTTQEYVDKFSTEIRTNTGLPLEEVTVVDTRFGRFHNPIMRTTIRKIFIDSTKDINTTRYDLEWAVLHELGHRVQHAINPQMYNIVHFSLPAYSSQYEHLGGIGYFPFLMKFVLSGDIFIEKGLGEGAAEFFTLDIFQYCCSISNVGRDFMRKRIDDHNCRKSTYRDFLTISMGYRFYHAVHEAQGLGGIVEFTKRVQADTIPFKKELSNPHGYIEKHIGDLFNDSMQVK